MKLFIWSILLCLTFTLTACGSSTPTAVPLVTPVPVPVVNASSSDVVVASAVVAPAQMARLGFTISSLVKEVAVKEGDIVRVGQSLVVLDTPELGFAVAAAEAANQSASINAELQSGGRVKVFDSKTGSFILAGLPKELQLIAQAKADQAQAVLETAKANLALATLFSPFDGTVVSVNVIPGELVQPDQVVITIAALGKLQIETTDLSERDISRVYPGQSVDVFIKPLGVTITGRVIRISPIADALGGDVVYPVTIELDEQPIGMLWGMTAEVQIQTQ